jgi:hypothetical protein
MKRGEIWSNNCHVIIIGNKIFDGLNPHTIDPLWEIAPFVDIDAAKNAISRIKYLGFCMEKESFIRKRFKKIYV